MRAHFWKIFSAEKELIWFLAQIFGAERGLKQWAVQCLIIGLVCTDTHSTFPCVPWWNRCMPSAKDLTPFSFVLLSFLLFRMTLSAKDLWRKGARFHTGSCLNVAWNMDGN